VFALATSLAATALLDPRYGAPSTPLLGRGAEIVVALDVSRSMAARDATPDRLEAAKRAIRSLAEAARGDRFALVLFAGEARLIAPSTEDVDAVARMAAAADLLSIPKGGSDLGAAIRASLAATREEGDRARAILLLTDGEDHAGRGRDAAAEARKRGVAVHAAVFGTARGGRISREAEDVEGYVLDSDGAPVLAAADLDGLRRLAEAGGGTAVADAAKPGALVGWYEAHVAPISRKPSEAASAAAAPRRAFELLSLALLLWMIEPWLFARRRR
jgi:Ca-activated chloride channel homolog